MFSLESDAERVAPETQKKRRELRTTGDGRSLEHMGPVRGPHERTERRGPLSKSALAAVSEQLLLDGPQEPTYLWMAALQMLEIEANTTSPIHLLLGLLAVCGTFDDEFWEVDLSCSDITFYGRND
ncbi:unnamed protein product [Lampetra planeri]